MVHTSMCGLQLAVDQARILLAYLEGVDETELSISFIRTHVGLLIEYASLEKNEVPFEKKHPSSIDHLSQLASAGLALGPSAS